MKPTTPRRLVIALSGALAAATAATILVTVRVDASEQASSLPSGGTTAVSAPPTTVAPTTTAAPTTTVPPTTSTVAPATTIPPTTTVPPSQTPAGSSVGEGSDEASILGLQQRLHELHYWVGTPDGRWGKVTAQAVLAFQKAEGLERDGKAGPATLARLVEATVPQPTRLEDGVEISLDRQVIFLVSGGQVQWVVNTSTGTARTPTPRGDFVVQREIDGVRHAPLGDLYRPKYFNGGIAVHGSPSIPGYPASHGCARVSNAAMDFLWSSGLIEVGTPVRVI